MNILKKNKNFLIGQILENIFHQQGKSLYA